MKGIYKFTNIVTNKVYIGSSSNIIRRYESHINDLLKDKSGCTLLQNSVTKHGIKNFSFTILEIIEDLSNLPIREKYWIDYYNACDKKYGYNIQLEPLHGTRGLKLTEKHKEAISNGLKGRKVSEETKKKISKSLKGHLVSEKTIEAVRKAHLGRPSGKRKPVIKMDLEENYLEEYDSIREAALKNSVGHLSIMFCLNGKKDSFKGFKWKYKQ